MIETKDLWQSAYLLAQGSGLEEVKVAPRYDGKREVVFVFDGRKVEELVRRFQTGRAECNVRDLRASVNHLKEVIFERLKT